MSLFYVIDCRPNHGVLLCIFYRANTLRIRCRGAIPTLTTWINDVKIAELDAANLQREGYNRDAVAALLGPRGHIALEVHHHTPNSPERWGHGAYCRWRNLFIRDL